MAKMIQRGVSIYIDQQDAERAVEALQVKFDNLNKKLKELESTGKKGNGEWKKTTAEIKKTDAALGLVSKELKTTEMSMSQLRAVSARLQNQLNKTKPNTPEWEKYNNALAETRVEITRLNSKQRETEAAFLKMNGVTREHHTSMTKLANSFNKYQALALGFIASITGVAFAIKNVIREFAKLDDVFANVSKNTGLTIEEVKELDERLKAYDTRTAREELLKLASEAGKAGETGVENLNGIVQSLDKIKVALGEDLGEDAITDLLKIANVSGLKDMMGTADAINAIGSAVNELGQKSVAKEAYIISFTQRLGGVAKQANISAQNIMGFASALDQAGMNVEMSSTALQQFLMKMMEDPAKFAKIAGLEVKSFTELVAKDTNAAIIQMLEAMHSKGGFQALIPMFSDMGTEGVRAVSVLSTLAGQIQGVKEAQELSNTAFTEGNSLTEEFNKRNNNAQAELDKSKKKFLENSVALGEKLYPAMKMSLSGASYLIKAISFLVTNFNDLVKIVGLTVTTWGIYMVTMEMATIKTKLMIVQTSILIARQKLLNFVTNANPWGLLATALLTAAAAMGIYRGVVNETIDVEDEAAKAKNEEIEKLKNLQKELKRTNLSKEALKRITDEINKIAPGMLSNLDEEALKTGEVSKQLEKYIRLKELKRNIEVEDELQGSFKSERDDLLNSDQTNWFERNLYNTDKIDKLNKERKAKRLEELDRYIKESQDRQKIFSESTNKLEEEIGNKPTITPISAGGGTGDDKKPWEKKIKALEDNLKLSKAINEKALLEKNINEEQYNRLNLEADELFLQKKLNVLKLHKQATGDVELEIAKNKAELQKLSFSQEIQLAQDAKNQFLLELEIKRQRGEVTENTYNANIIAADVAFMKKRIEIQQKYGDSTIISQTELLRKRKELEASFKELVKTDDEKLVDDPNENPALSENMKLDVEEAILKNKYKNNLINKQEYENEMEKIAKKRWDNEIGFLEKYFDIAVNSTQKMGEAVSGFKDAELTKAETNYTKEEKALDNKLKRGLISQQEYDTQKNALEEKYQEEQKAIKKKYAGVELVISIGKIIAETALAVMSSFAQLGPIAGIPFAAIMAAVGASQIALATAQYQQIQGLEQGLYPTVTRQQDGKKFKVNSVGNMQTGVYSQPSVLVGEAGPELVVDNKRFNKIMKERPEVINYIVNGFEKGKYPTISQNAIKIAKGSGDSKLQAAIDQLLISINESDIYVLRKKLRKADKTISDINNKFN